MSGAQATFLLAFNDRNKISVKDLEELTKMHSSLSLRALQPLVKCGLLVSSKDLTKEGEGSDAEISINNSFESKRHKVDYLLTV